jgi:hypothetical protein
VFPPSPAPSSPPINAIAYCSAPSCGSDFSPVPTSAPSIFRQSRSADLGVGLILTRTVGITPQVSIPFSSGPSDAVFTIRFTFNFGN